MVRNGSHLSAQVLVSAIFVGFGEAVGNGTTYDKHAQGHEVDWR